MCILAVLYLAMSLAIIGVIPARAAMHSNAIVSDLCRRFTGNGGGFVDDRADSGCGVCLGILRAAGFYAGALCGGDGRAVLFGIRACSPKRKFPSFSVLFMGVTSAAACLLSLESLITGLIVIQIVTQFVAQCFAVVLIRRNRPDIERPFRMPLYPLPVILAALGWLYILYETGSVTSPAAWDLC